jgi:hypothetical protein
MTDLRELLRDLLPFVVFNPGMTARINEALAQSPDAKPVGRVDENGIPWLFGPSGTKLEPGALLYAAPQLPAGKGETAASGRIRAWIRGAMQPSTPHGPAEYNEECVPGEDQPEGEGWMPLYFVSPDAIPREIHERLVRDAKAQALREAAKWFDSEHDKSNPTPWRAKVSYAGEKLRRMASEHE